MSMKKEQQSKPKRRLYDDQFAKHGRDLSFSFQQQALDSFRQQSQIDGSEDYLEDFHSIINNNNNNNNNNKIIKNVESQEQKKQVNDSVFQFAVPQPKQLQIQESNLNQQLKQENESQQQTPISPNEIVDQILPQMMISLKQLKNQGKEINQENRKFKGEIENQNDFIVGTNDYSSISSSTNKMNLSQKQKLKEQKKLRKNPLFKHISRQNLPRIDPSAQKPIASFQTTNEVQKKNEINPYFSFKRDKSEERFQLQYNQNENQENEEEDDEDEDEQEQCNLEQELDNDNLEMNEDLLVMQVDSKNNKQEIEKELEINDQKQINIIPIKDWFGNEDDRSRQRTEKQQKHEKYRQTERERDFFDSHPLGEKMKRSMNDIQGQQLRTSYALTKKSFKWSNKVKTLLFSKKRTQDAQLTQEQVAYEVYNHLDNQKDQGVSSDDSLELEEEGEIGELHQIQMKVIRASQKASTVEKGFKFKQNRNMRNHQMSNYDLNLNNISKDIKSLNKVAVEALHSFLEKLQQKGDLRTSVENFGEAMTMFFQLKEQFEQGINSDSFVLSSSIGEGSFGQVDLYFLKSHTQLMSNNASNCLQQTASQSNAQIISLAQTVQSSTQQMPINLQQNNNISNQALSQIQLVNADSGLFGSTQPITGFTKVASNQILIEHSIPLGQENSKNIFQECMPVAGKKIKNLDEFTRELFIMQSVKCEYMPKLIFADLEKQLLFMELGLCSLEELKQDSDDMGYTFSDEFTYQILVQIIKAIEALLNHIDVHSNKPRPLFHSDIKPSNIMLTVKKYPRQPNCSLKLLLIDFGGASFAIDDYWAFFTPAFVCSTLYQKLVQNQNNRFHLSWEEIRFAEVYAACRSVQLLLISDQQKHLFQQENYEQFLQEKSYIYPKTCSILSAIFRNQVSQPWIKDIYENILSPQEKQLYTGLNPQNISFESQKIFQLSKFHTASSNKQQKN